MKDIVENRQRLKLRQKMRLAVLALRENGIAWPAYMGLYYLGSSLADFGFGRADALRKAKRLPGLNSAAINKEIWENWDWSARGEEWTPSEGWKESIVRTFIDGKFPNGVAVLEIGPGGGRWTEYLIGKADRFIGIDISEACVNECRRRFAGAEKARFEVGNGRDLSSIPTGSIDRIWSFDVFVHINRLEFESYIKEFHRVLRPGGLGVIHHGSAGGSLGGWRSDMTAELVQELMEAHGLQVESQLRSWIDQGQEYQAGLYSDVITVFRKS